MKPFKVLDLFSGIGGFSLGLERTGGFETVAFCEIEPFARKVLAKHWPKVPCYEDVRTLTGELLRRDGISVDAITAGFPCQDISLAGKRAGIGKGTRSGLWSEIIRLAGELGPAIIVLENVSNLLSGPSGRPGGWFGQILGDLATLGYDAEWHCIPASALGAPHQRDRTWIVAYANEDGLQKREHVAGTGDKTPRSQQIRCAADRVSPSTVTAHADAGQLSLGRSIGRMGRLFESFPRDGNWKVASEPVLGRGADGIPNRVDRCGALGNAVVPQIPEIIGHAILTAIGRAA